MNIIYRVTEDQYELIIQQTYDYMYRIVIYIADKKEILAIFANRKFAIAAADSFSKLYTIARKEGYELVGDKFIHPNGPSLPVQYILKEFTPERLNSYLWELAN